MTPQLTWTLSSLEGTGGAEMQLYNAYLRNYTSVHYLKQQLSTPITCRSKLESSAICGHKP